MQTDALKPATETVEIKNRWTGEMMFTAEVEAGLGSASIKLGAAVMMAVRARANLADANLAGADLARADLADANLAGADLARADLARAYLAGANLAGADLARADLADADLADANLAGADLARAYLARAYLAGANLADANLAGANLTGANLAGAYLARANLARANLARAYNLLDCGSPHGWRVVVVMHEDGIRIAAGCRWFTFSAAAKHWRDRTVDRPLMQPLLAYIQAAAEIKGWKVLMIDMPYRKAVS